jgi:acyl carrier protein
MTLMDGTNDTLARLQKIFQDVFLDDGLTLSPETNSDEFESWDSLTHVTLMVHVERVFDIQFTSSEIAAWKDVGELVQLIDARQRQKG